MNTTRKVEVLYTKDGVTYRAVASAAEVANPQAREMFFLRRGIGRSEAGRCLKQIRDLPTGSHA